MCKYPSIRRTLFIILPSGRISWTRFLSHLLGILPLGGLFLRWWEACKPNSKSLFCEDYFFRWWAPSQNPPSVRISFEMMGVACVHKSKSPSVRIIFWDSKHELSWSVMGCVTCHTRHASVTDFRPILGNPVEVTHVTSPGHVYSFPH